MQFLNGKRVLVVGLARSGVSAAILLARLGADVTVNDAKPADALAEGLNRLPTSVKTVCGSHPDVLYTTADLIVVSPGVPDDLPQLQKARSHGVPIIGELECAFSAAGRVTPHGHPAPRFLAVTGTNGKSTTTTLLYEMMRNAGYGVLLCGNIGVSVSEALLASGLADVGAAFRRAIDFFVVEVSSFQLDSVETFRPSGATILNVAPDHLDRYRGMDAYVASKSRIFENQGSPDVLVLNADDPFAPELDLKWEGLSELPDVYYFSRKQVVRGAYTAGSKVVLSFGGTEHSIDISTFGIRGAHNVENAMAASLLALTAGAGIDAVEKALREFRGLEHRMELVREVDGVQYVNDSKGTNVAAVMKSLESYTQPVILIAGGRDKDGDFNLLREPVREKVKTLILIGEAAHKISEALGDMTRTVYADSLKEAVATARAHAVPGDIVLLSPACASFDMFRNYEDRGDQFKMLVRSL